MAAALVFTLFAAACSKPTSGPVSSSPVPESTMRVLGSSSVPDVPSRTAVLGLRELAKDASIPGLASKIDAWGYLDGRERTFQGQSRHLTLVVSRAMVFKDAAGAGDYVVFVRDHAPEFFGGAVGIRRLVVQGRRGWLYAPAPCACHRANPAFVGVLSDGSNVVWLEINGPDATRALLKQLLDPARSVPTALPG